MAEYTEAYIAFMRECRNAYNDLCGEIDAGNVPPGNKATVKITVPAVVVDRIRFDCLAVVAEADDG